MKTKTSPFLKVKRTFAFALKVSPKGLAFNIVLGLLKSVFPYIAIYFGALIIDSLVSHQPSNVIMRYVYIMTGSSLVIGLSIGLINNYLESLNETIFFKMRQLTAKKNMELAYSQVEDQEILRLIQSAEEGTNASGGLSSFFLYLQQIITVISSVIYSIVLLSGLFVVYAHQPIDQIDAFLSHPLSALVIFAFVALSLVVSFLVSITVYKIGKKAESENVEANRRFSYFYTITGNYTYGKDIRLFHMQPFIGWMQEHDMLSVNRVWDTYCKASTVNTIITSVLLMVLSFVSYGFLGLKSIYGYYSIGKAVSYVGAVTLLGSSLRNLIMAITQINLVSAYLEKYFIYLNLTPGIKYGEKTFDNQLPFTLELSHLSFTYPNQKEKALDDVSLKIGKGQKLAIVGLNGAGKTTIVKLIARFYNPDSGKILIDGIPIEEYNKESLNQIAAIVFQDFKLFSYSVKENVAGSDVFNLEKVEDSLKRAGIYERVMSFPKGLDTILYNENDENGVEISGGEAQKIAIARALYKDSPLVILDEPTSALDPKSEAEIYEKFNNLVDGKAAIFISHRMSSTKFCDNIVVINNGKVVEYGSHLELLKLNGLYKKLWDAQAQYYQ